MSRGRGFSQDWDPMREDFDNSAYDPQYPDDNSSGLVSLDHTRLYITNIPRGLSDEGVYSAFSKYGRTIEKHIGGDPQRRYALIGFETPGEAKLAMMKLNRTEPLNLCVRIAHKRKSNTDNYTARGRNEQEERSFREDTASVGSRSNSSRRHQDMSNGDNMDDSMEDVAVNSLDPDTKLELEQLKLERLRLQEAQLACRERMLLKQAERKLQSSTSRRVLPTGKIVLCNNATAESGRDNDATFVAGAGDSLKIPGLQRVGKCVACGERADAFCAACGVTPYCSERCQRRDWQQRHQQVCHNLKRSPAPAPLRRPRSPEAARERRDDDSGSDRAAPRKFGPPGGVQANVPRNARGTNRNSDQANNSYDRGDRANNSYDRGDRANNSYDRGDKPNNSYDRGDRANNDRANNDRARNDRANNSYDRGEKPNSSYERGDRPKTSYDRGNRTNEGSRPTQNGHRNFNDRNDDRKNDARNEQDDGWNAKPEPKPQASIPTPTIKPKTPLALSAQQTQAVPKPPVVQETRKEPLVPKNAVVELLTANDSFAVTVEAAAALCRAGAGFVGVAIPNELEEQYVGLMDDQFAARQAAGAVCRPKPGETFAYLNPEDGAWYRARCVAPTQAALLDAARVIDLAPDSQCRALHANDAAVPEFCCLLEDAKVQVGSTLTGTVISNTDGVLTVSLVNAENNAAVGTARLRRWVPRVDAPPAACTHQASAASVAATSAIPAASAAPVASTSAAPASNIPDVPRPPVTNNSKVLIIDAAKPSRVFVRGAGRDQQRQFDDVVQEVALYGVDATPLTELPTVGDTVVAKFEDGIHYRALCRRVSLKNNKCLLEYIEYGNETVAFLGDIYPCPPEMTLTVRPTLASRVTFEMPHDLFTPAAVEYINARKEAELTLTIPSGAQSGPSGTAVKLTTERGEDLNRAIEDLCTPEWKRLLARGGDVLDMAVLLYKDLEFVDPPASGELEILDMGHLESGTVSGHARGAPHVARALDVERQLVEYCNSPLCKEPYLPKLDEVCALFCPNLQKWVRGMLVDHKNGEPEGMALLLDYGAVQCVPVQALRKLPAEYVRAAPAAVQALEIRGFPAEPTPEQIARAIRHMQTDARGRGRLRYTRVENIAHGDYIVDAPELLQAMQ